MNKHKNYHMYGLLAIIILILLIIFFSLYIGRNTNGSSALKPSQTQSSASPGTDIIKAPDNDSEVSAYLEEQNTIISDMLENMRVKESGSAELDFLVSMIPHYEASVDLSKSYLLLGGKNKQLKSLANEIIEEQTEEIDDMRELIQKIQKSGITDKKKEKGYLALYNKMISSHQHITDETEASNNVEKAYIEGMVIHHQMAVDMADAILKYSTHHEILDIAEDILEMQKEEISQMEKIFNDI